MSIGKVAASIVGRFGFCSRKTAVRLASETGTRMFDESIKMGRSLNQNETEYIINKVIPKRLRPKILNSVDEAVSEMSKRGVPQDTIEKFMAEVQGCALTLGRKKAPIFVNAGSIEKLLPANFDRFQISALGSAATAHELEHAIEYNCTLKGILKRKFVEPIVIAFKQNKAKFLGKVNNYNIRFQTALQEGGASGFGQSRCQEIIDSVVKNSVKGSKKIKRLSKGILELEIPAYQTGSNVENHVAKIYPDVIKPQSFVLDIYEKANTSLKGL